jgi:hypothetical protein
MSVERFAITLSAEIGGRDPAAGSPREARRAPAGGQGEPPAASFP